MSLMAVYIGAVLFIADLHRVIIIDLQQETEFVSLWCLKRRYD